MSVQYYTPIKKVVETLKCNNCRPKSNLTLNREFGLHLQKSKETSTYKSQKAINIDTSI